MTTLEEKIPAVMRNEFFYAFARVCMVVSLPIGGFFGNRMLAKADDISEQVAKQSIQLQILSSEVKYRFDNIADHETRIRQLERK